LTDRGRRVARVALAVGFAATLSYVVVQLLPDRLDVTTDIVGYPTHSNFNVYRHFHVYYSVVFLFPVVAFATFWLLGRLIPDGKSVPNVDASVVPSTVAPADEIGIAQLLLTGSVYGVAAAVVIGVAVPSWAVVLTVASVYAVVVVAFGASRSGPLPHLSLPGRIAAANAFVASLSTFALYAVASSTRVIIGSTGEVRAYQWLPLWVALIATAAIGFVFASRVARAATTSDARRAEREALLLVAAPVILFLSLSGLPGAVGRLDMFHDGEWLVPVKLIFEDGFFPWRDLFFIHGLIEDVVRPGLGFVALEQSVWGGVAGMVLLGSPLYWVSMYFLNAYLFRRNLPFLVLTTALLATGITGGAHFRVILLPLLLLLLAALIAKATPWRAASFALALVVLAITTPEMSYAVLACGGVVLFYELVHRRKSIALVENFARSIWSVGAGLVLVLGWMGFLATQGSADDFIYYYKTFAPDHALTGGIPVRWLGPEFAWAVGLPIALILLALLYVVIRRHRLIELDRDDWVMASVAVLLLLYYPKFLSRADGHIYHVYAVAVPLFFYVAYRVCTSVDAAIMRLNPESALSTAGRHPVTMALACAVLLLPLTSPATRLAGIERRFAPTVAEAPWLREIGFATPAAFDRRVFADLAGFFGAFLRPGDLVFDFSNEPALSFYLLQLSPSTRYYHVSMAIRSDTQRDLIEQLGRQQPRVVIFHNDRFGLPSWDGVPNMVRHYLVSEYLLDNYRPLVWLHGHLLMVRADEQIPPNVLTFVSGVTTSSRDDLEFRAGPCNWGYAPNFVRLQPGADSLAGAIELAARPGRSVLLRGWAADPAASRPAKEVVAVLNGMVIQRTTPSVDRPDVAAALKTESLRASGYQMAVPFVGTDESQRIKVFAVSWDGAATELLYGAAAKSDVDPIPSSLLSIVDDGRDAIPVRARGAVGWVDSSTASSNLVAVELPPGARTNDFRWVEIEGAAPFGDSAITLSDDFGELSHAITFKTLDRAEDRYRVSVASCIQWHGYRSRTLYLTSTTPISVVRLIP
jgi:hypothetical protein